MSFRLLILCSYADVVCHYHATIHMIHAPCVLYSDDRAPAITATWVGVSIYIQGFIICHKSNESFAIADMFPSIYLSRRQVALNQSVIGLLVVYSCHGCQADAESQKQQAL